MDYSQKTQDLIDRQCRNVERRDFKLDKKKSEELILKTYDLFDLPRPKKIVWCKDIFDKKFDASARSAWSARSASSASSAWSARSARSASSASSASSARSASSASSARSAWSAALDYDFDYYIFAFEYREKPDSDKPVNENDLKYLEYCELLMQAKEAGLGYRVEWEDILYLVPTPIVSIDEQNRFHSIIGPAIYWKGGKELYFLHGVSFEKKWWTKIVKDKMNPGEIFAIDNMEHRRIAYEMMDKTKMKKLKDFKVLDEVKDDGFGKSMRIVSFTVQKMNEPLKFLNCYCPSTGREYYLGTDKEKCWEAKMGSFGLSGENKFTHEF